MRRWKVFDLDGFGPAKVLQDGVIEADTPREALLKAWEFKGSLDTEDVREPGLVCFVANEESSKKFPGCHVCGAGKCVGHLSKGTSMVATVVEMV